MSEVSVIQNALRHFCAYQERCHSEVRHKLLELGCRGDELEDIITMLIEENYLNEERFAKSYVGGKFRVNHWGRKKIIQQLKLKRVSDYCIKQGLKEINEEDYTNMIASLAEKKLKELKNVTHQSIRKQKLVRYLLQKGFEQDTIWSVIVQYFPK